MVMVVMTSLTPLLELSESNTVLEGFTISSNNQMRQKRIKNSLGNKHNGISKDDSASIITIQKIFEDAAKYNYIVDET